MSERQAPRNKKVGNREPLAEPEEVSEYLKIPELTLSQWRSRGGGPKWSKIGRHVRYRWSDVDAWVEQRAGDAA